MARTVDVIVQAHDRMSKQLGGMERSLGGFSRTLKGAIAGIGAYFGGRAILRGLSSSLDAFGLQEQAVTKLQRAMDDLGAGDQVAGLRAYASELQDLTTVGDEASLELMQLGASIGRLSGDQLKAATKAAIGFSKAYGIDTKAAMVLVAKAAQGNTSALSRYGIQLEEGLSDQEKFQEILRRGAEAFGVAEAEADTYAGRMQQMRNAVGDLKESIGEQLAPVVKDLAEGFLKHKETITAFAVGAVEGFRNLLRGAVEAFTAVQVVIENWKEGLGAGVAFVKAAVLGWVEDVKHVFTQVLPRYIEWFAENWVEVLRSAVDAVRTIFTNMGSNIVAILKNLPKLIKGEISIGELWTPLLEGFEATFEALPEIAGRALTDQERELLATAAELGGSIGDEIKAKVAMRLAALGLDEPLAGAATPGGGPALGGAAGAGAAAQEAGAYRQMKAFESMLTLRAPGQDPMARQIELSKRMLAALEKVEKHTAKTEQHTKPQGGGRYEPAPVY